MKLLVSHALGAFTAKPTVVANLRWNFGTTAPLQSKNSKKFNLTLLHLAQSSFLLPKLQDPQSTAFF
jgi:hypothetical protein